MKGIYGPYADNLRHVLNRVEGHFLTGFGDGSASVTEAEPIALLDGAGAEAEVVVAADDQLRRRIDRVLALADGFESSYGMELLATAHWAASSEGCDDRACVIATVHGWSKRKEQLFTERHVVAALDQLVAHGWLGEDFAA